MGILPAGNLVFSDRRGGGEKRTNGHESSVNF